MVAPDNDPATLYVSPSGDDAWSGTCPEPRADGRDGPLATLEKARDLLRQRRQAGRLEAGATAGQSH